MPTATEKSREQFHAARAAKRAHAEALGVDERFVSLLVERFYGNVRKDELLAPIFAERISDWPHHLERMKTFWRSILFNSGEFSGNPMVKHMAIPGLEKAHFVRWLELFYTTLHDLGPQPDGTKLVAERARAIADSLLTGITIRRDGISGSKTGRTLPHV
ncbi:MAG: group III truncated hemoglobin [Parvularcula sp.]|jgi:hemoglobin|nr:group III truncated hemoglobin [Parvularcula sp.]